MQIFQLSVFMLIIIDSKSPEPSKKKLRKYGDILEFSSSGITYESISGHPDIFLCKVNDTLIASPNIPESYKIKIASSGIKMKTGSKGVGMKYPDSAVYNAVVDENLIIHNQIYTDQAIRDATEHMLKISVNQGYTRCNLLALGNNTFITSDIGIYYALKKHDLLVLYVIPENIILPGFNSGFFGGACGIFDDRVIINGNLDYYPDGKKVRIFLKKLKLKTVELYKGPLFDGGSILIL